MLSYFFGYPETEEEPEESNQPSYRTIKQRHLLMQQIRCSKLKLKKVFRIEPIYHPIGYNSYRFSPGIKK